MLNLSIKLVNLVFKFFISCMFIKIFIMHYLVYFSTTDFVDTFNTLLFYYLYLVFAFVVTGGRWGCYVEVDCLGKVFRFFLLE